MTREEVIQKLEAGDKNFKICNLSGLNLCDANLCDANLCDANLRGADLRHADLRDANLCDANLRDADLRHADLCGANLCGANLRGANLCGANLRDAYLRDADIDYACWPLWCGGLHVKIDKRIACQLAYHFCAQDCDDPEYIAARNAILSFANQFHRTEECGLLELGDAR
uniref:pentapeptide repeat-containing protein n=1 Tax=Candidatus Fimivicinus sp. TaxID=3056640 RepID=UPI004024F575